jgi:transcriptional regulator with PAS, ATPase and Fis domain
MSKPHYEHHVEPVTDLIGEPSTGLKLRIKGAKLRVASGPDQGLEKWLPSHGLTVGKSTSCNFLLTDQAVSAEHFRIIPTGKGFHLQDLSSRNGTWLHGARLGEVYLSADTSIEIGYSRLCFELTSGHQEYAISNQTSFGSMVGQSLAMRQAFSLLERAATSDATVLIEGESGTGKDLAAESVHNLSARRAGPFVPVDCGALNAEMVESQLFGHRAGAFTGAVSDRIGAFEAAEGGTLFLDEIGELSPALQPKLLRVLEHRQVRRLGETAFRPVNVRFIAATNRDLESEVSRGRFREDLFFRLSVLRVHLLPLRNREEDIAPLASMFIQKLRPNANPKEILTDDVLRMLNSHSWPGNNRELRNVIERLLVFPEWPEKAIDPTDDRRNEGCIRVPFSLPFSEAKDLVNDQFEQEYLDKLLIECGGVVVEALKKGNIPRQTFYRLLRAHRLDTKRYKTPR